MSSYQEDFIGTLPSNLDLREMGLHGELKKGHIIDAFAYARTEDFSIKKTGKELKEKLDKVIAYETAEISKYLALASQYKCPDIEPMGVISEYMLSGYSSSSFENLPKLYSYEQKKKYRGGDEDNTIKENESYFDSNQKEMSTYDKMQKYNDYIRKVVECMVEVKIANTIKNGVDDNKTYPLSIRQAAAIGF